MKFKGTTDIDASLNATFADFADFADFESFERIAQRSGGQVARTDDLTSPGPGMMWDLRIDFKGKPRKIKKELVDYDPPNSLFFEAAAGVYDLTVEVVLTSLSAKSTRIAVSMDLTTSSIAGKLVLQSARLTKNKLNKKFRHRLRSFGATMEERIHSA